MRGLSSLEITTEMAPGVNLWNTLDAVCWWCGECSNGLESEIIWGQPYTKPEMLQAIADKGFKSIRIPVSWFNHMGAYPDYTIDEEWMDRVEEVVNFALEANLYAIINIHHDDYNEEHEGSWICPTYEKQDTVTDQLLKLWTQIASRFKDYGDYLIFETMNEPREVGGEKEWQGGTAEHREVINAFNLAAVNAIRTTGGNNETRFIILPQVGANVASALEDMVIPNGDTNTIVSVHAYYPYWFTIGGGTDRWGTPAEVAELGNAFAPLSEKFVANGIGVVMGEWGADDQDNYDQRINYYETYTNICKQNGITPIAWIYDFNRKTLTWEHPLIADAILQAYDSTFIPVEDLVLDITSDTLFVGESLQLSALISPDTASTQGFAWVSRNKNIASVNSLGLITAKSQGNTKIIAATIGKSSEFNLVVLDTIIDLDFHFEAEEYKAQSGVQAESCSDAGGGQNIGYIENGDWCSYFIVVDSTGIYNFTARVATATNGGTFRIKANNRVVGTVTVEGSKSNGWQDWYTTEPIKIELKAGAYDIRLDFSGGININWFELVFYQSITSSIQNMLSAKNDFKVYPNPFSNGTTINYSLERQESVSIEIYNLEGKRIKTLSSNKIQNSGVHSIDWDGTDNRGGRAEAGVYIIRFRAGAKEQSVSLMKVY